MAERTPLHEQTAAGGAVFAEESGWLTPAHFGDPLAEYDRARGGAVLVDQSSRGKVEVRGADAARFLHNLSTNDIVRLAPGAGCEAFLTTNKAKVIAYVLIFRQDLAKNQPSFWLDATPGAADRVLQHLDRFLISEQVEFVDRTREYAQMHLAGPRAEDRAETTGRRSGSARGTVAAHRGRSRRRVPRGDSPSRRAGTAGV